MYKKVIILLALFFVLGVGASKTLAAYLNLTRIGTLSTAGLNFTTWSITGAVPDLSGTATPGATVAVTVNAVTATTSASIAGVWTYLPTNIVNGSNSVSIASGNESISFLLSYTPAASPTAAVIPDEGEIPEAGNEIWPLLLIGLGTAIFIIGKKAKDRVSEEWNI